jgi:uncharacterized membrane protein/protein-disulfide isomerase
MSSRTRALLLVLAIAGLAVSTASAWVHYQVLTNPSYISPCDINATFNCTQVYMSRFGSFRGVPVALGGVIWFALVALIAWFSPTGDKGRSTTPYIFALSIVGLAVVLYLGYASFFVLKTGCVLCMATYACVLGIFLVSALAPSDSMSRLPGRFSRDLRALASQPTMLLVALLFLAGAASVVAFFPKEGSRAEQAAAAPPPAADVQERFKQVWNKLPKVDLGIPANGAKVIIVKFNDYECPGCRVTHEGYKPVLAKFEAVNPGAVKLITKDWPWNSQCNFNVPRTIPGHEGACDAAAAVRMAAARGKGSEMETWVFSNQPTTSAVIRARVQAMLGVTNFDAEYAKVLPDMRRDIADGGVLSIGSTPTLFINGIRVPSDNGLMPPEYFELAINIELAKAGK